MRRLLLLAPLAVLVLTGCIRLEIAIRVSDDGSGTVSVLTAVDDSVLAALGGGAGGGGLRNLLGDGDLATALTEVDEADLPAPAARSRRTRTATSPARASRCRSRPAMTWRRRLRGSRRAAARMAP